MNISAILSGSSPLDYNAAYLTRLFILGMVCVIIMVVYVWYIRKSRETK